MCDSLLFCEKSYQHHSSRQHQFFYSWTTNAARLRHPLNKTVNRLPQESYCATIYSYESWPTPKLFTPARIGAHTHASLREPGRFLQKAVGRASARPDLRHAATTTTRRSSEGDFWTHIPIALCVLHSASCIALSQPVHGLRL